MRDEGIPVFLGELTAVLVGDFDVAGEAGVLGAGEDAVGPFPDMVVGFEMVDLTGAVFAATSLGAAVGGFAGALAAGFAVTFDSSLASGLVSGFASDFASDSTSGFASSFASSFASDLISSFASAFLKTLVGSGLTDVDNGLMVLVTAGSLALGLLVSPASVSVFALDLVAILGEADFGASLGESFDAAANFGEAGFAGAGFGAGFESFASSDSFESFAPLEDVCGRGVRVGEPVEVFDAALRSVAITGSMSASFLVGRRVGRGGGAASLLQIKLARGSRGKGRRDE